ncbi:MAG: sortase [Patescibacteria group bacterium]
MKKIYYFLHWFANGLVIGGVIIFLLSFWPTVSSEFRYRLLLLKNPSLKVSSGEDTESRFADLAKEPTPLRVSPVSKDFGIVIESIDVNAPVVADVSVSDPTVYKPALRNGVAHAKGTAKPGDIGNIFLFAHSSLNFWQLGKYATVFNLLRKLKEGERVVLFYNGERYDYFVQERYVVPGWDISPLVEKVSEGAMLTLQTCHPPGTTANRLIVRALPSSSF